MRETVITTYTTYPENRDAIKKYADEHGMSVSAVIRVAVKEFLVKENKCTWCRIKT